MPRDLIFVEHKRAADRSQSGALESGARIAGRLSRNLGDVGLHEDGLDMMRRAGKSVRDPPADGTGLSQVTVARLAPYCGFCAPPVLNPMRR